MDFLYLFKDINFQMGVLLVAALLLIMMILNVAYKLNKMGGEKPEGWPPTVAPCPDYWDISGGYCINTNGQNIGFEGGGKYSIWNSPPRVCNNIASNTTNNPYKTFAPIICSDTDHSGLRTIPIGTMYYYKTSNKLVGGGISNIGDYVDIKKKNSKKSRKDWANKYGFVWDGLNTKW